MEPSTIASHVLSILVPYALRGATNFVRVAGEAACNQVKKLVDTLDR